MPFAVAMTRRHPSFTVTMATRGASFGTNRMRTTLSSVESAFSLCVRLTMPLTRPSSSQSLNIGTPPWSADTHQATSITSPAL